MKWAIFGVCLPLLTIAARVAAAWLDGRGSTLGFTALFGDGELLVLATVVAAAGIGDLLFDVSGHRRLDGAAGLRVALMHALALIVVVGSVLFFGLVTYANQTRIDAREQAQAEQVAEQNAASADIAAARQRDLRAEALDGRRLELVRRQRRVSGRLGRELDGTGGSRLPGFGPLAQRLSEQAKLLASESARLKREASQLRAQAAAETAGAAQRVTSTSAEVDQGREQAAVVSVIMFLFSLAAAYPVVGLTALDASYAESSARP